jgi:hypothetical protein
MKAILRIQIFLMLAALPAFLSAQSVSIEYMKVTQESEGLYLEVEKEWKKVHQARIKEGLVNGWQLWRNISAGYGDDFQYMTINWYKDMAHATAPAPDGFWDNLQTTVDQDIIGRTWESRVLVTREFSHSMFGADTNHGAKWIQVNYMKTKPGKWNEYLDIEREIFKPIFEEAINRGYRASWGVWQMWPYEEGEVTLVTVDGYDSWEQRFMDQEDLFKVVHPDMDMDELWDKLEAVREMSEVQIWELVDAAWPEDE